MGRRPSILPIPLLTASVDGKHIIDQRQHAHHLSSPVRSSCSCVLACTWAKRAISDFFALLCDTLLGFQIGILCVWTLPEQSISHCGALSSSKTLWYDCGKSEVNSKPFTPPEKLPLLLLIYIWGKKAMYVVLHSKSYSPTLSHLTF